MLLGPYPGNGSVSTWKYFNFLRSRIPRCLPECTVCDLHPGGETSAAVPLIARRPRAWRDNYLFWPARLIRATSELHHIIDHGLAWYARFLNPSIRLITVHDLISLLATRGKLPLRRVATKQLPLLWESLRQIRAADHIIAVSRNTADCLVRELDMPAHAITIIHNFLDPSFGPVPAEEFAPARAKYFGDAPYGVIHVGGRSAYKNRVGALRAFQIVLKRLPEARMVMVHGGPDHEEAAFVSESQCGHAVQFVPALSVPDLRALYAAADALIFPSVYEGFGWPPIEAMACGCPVVCSPCGSLAEVVGEAALVVPDPLDYAANARALVSVLTEPSTKRLLRERGFSHVKRFEPAVMLGQSAELYRKLLN